MRRRVKVMTFLLTLACVFGATAPEVAVSKPLNNKAVLEEALRLGEEFGVVVGEVDEETRDFLGLQRAEGVVVYEVIAGRPAELAGIKVKAVIKEIDKYEIRTLEDFGHALRAVRGTENFTVATYEPADPTDQGITGGVNFHFVRTMKD